MHARSLAGGRESGAQRALKRERRRDMRWNEGTTGRERKRDNGDDDDDSEGRRDR